MCITERGIEEEDGMLQGGWGRERFVHRRGRRSVRLYHTRLTYLRRNGNSIYVSIARQEVQAADNTPLEVDVRDSSSLEHVLVWNAKHTVLKRCLASNRVPRASNALRSALALSSRDLNALDLCCG